MPVSKQPIVSFTADSPKAEQTFVLFYLEGNQGMERALWVESFDLCPEFFWVSLDMAREDSVSVNMCGSVSDASLSCSIHLASDGLG